MGGSEPLTAAYPLERSGASWVVRHRPDRPSRNCLTNRVAADSNARGPAPTSSLVTPRISPKRGANDYRRTWSGTASELRQDLDAARDRLVGPLNRTLNEGRLELPRLPRPTDEEAEADESRGAPCPLRRAMVAGPLRRLPSGAHPLVAAGDRDADQALGMECANAGPSPVGPATKHLFVYRASHAAAGE